MTLAIIYCRDFEEEDDELLQWELEAMKAGGHTPKKSSKRSPDLKQQTRSNVFLIYYYI